jgi:hypothetical protein
MKYNCISKEEEKVLAMIDDRSIKKQSEYDQESKEVFDSRYKYVEAIIEAFGGEDVSYKDLFDALVAQMSDDEAFDAFDYILRMEGMKVKKDGTIGDLSEEDE